MGEVVELDPELISRARQRDLDFNKELAKNASAYWSSLGHIVKFEVFFNVERNYHYIKTSDLKNGLPYKEKLTPAARKQLTSLPQ